MKDEKVLRIPGRYDRGLRANRKRSLKFTEDRNERQSGKTDEKPAKRREIDCSVFLELCIVLRDRQGTEEEIHGFWRRDREEPSTHLENCTGRVRKDTMEKNQK